MVYVEDLDNDDFDEASVAPEQTKKTKTGNIPLKNYREITFFKEVKAVDTGRWFNVAGYNIGSIQVTGMPATYPPEVPYEAQNSVLVHQSLLPTLPNSSDPGFLLTDFGSDGIRRLDYIPKWIKVSLSAYHSGAISVYGLFVKT